MELEGLGQDVWQGVDVDAVTVGALAQWPPLRPKYS